MGHRAGGMAVALVAALAALCLLINPASAAPAQHTESAVGDFGSCLSGSRTGDLLLLIDESGSLHSTDKHAARVAAATYLVKQLATDADAGHLDLSVSVAAFADTYRQVQGWTTLSSSTVGSIDHGIESLRHRDDGYDTDYWTALDGARTSLEHRQDAAQTHCQAIVWFTDGQLDIASRTSGTILHPLTKPYSGSLKINSNSAATKSQSEAVTDLCRPTGLADTLRTDRVWTFAIGLQPPGAHQDFTLMRRISTGTAPGASRCGAISSPTPGSFQLASNIDSLLFAFDGLSAPGQPSIASTAGVCHSGEDCVQDQHAFVLDSSIQSVHILGTSTVPNAVVTLQGPSQKRITLTRSSAVRSANVGPVAISWSWISGQSLQIDMQEPSPDRGWTGQWALVFNDPPGSVQTGVSRSDIHITSDITAGWPQAGSTTLRAGSRVSGVNLTLLRHGTPLDPSSIKGTIKLSAVLLDANGHQVATVADNVNAVSLSQPFTLDLHDLQPGKASLRLALVITTASATVGSRTIRGTALSPQITQVPLTIDPPLNYPTVPNTLHFGSITGTTGKTATLQVNGPGCAWVSSGSVKPLALPSGVGSLTLGAKATTQSSCVSAGQGQSSALPVVLHLSHQGKGEAKGTVSVSLAPSDGSGKPIIETVAFDATLHHSLNSTNFLLAFVLALLLGIGLPLLLLYAAKRFESRIPPGTLLAERFVVAVTPDRVARDGAPLAPRDRDFVDHPVIVPKRARQLVACGIPMRTTVSLRPGALCDVVVEAPGLIGVSSARETSVDQELQPRLPLAVRNHWVLLHDPRGSQDVAELLLVINADLSPTQRAALFDDASRRVPGALTRLRAGAREKGLINTDDRTFVASGGAGFGEPDDPIANPFDTTDPSASSLNTPWPDSSPGTVSSPGSRSWPPGEPETSASGSGWPDSSQVWPPKAAGSSEQPGFPDGPGFPSGSS
jgi:hypothetical protein